MDEEQLLQEFYLNKNKIKELTDRNGEISAELALAQRPTGRTEVGKLVVEISSNTRFDPALATELFPLGENGENFNLYKAQVDATLAKKFLSDEDYRRCQKIFPNNKVEVKLR